MPQEKSSKSATIGGLALAGSGLLHFVRPQVFEGIAKLAFPTDTARHLKINGGLETALGFGVALPQTRKLALVGLLGYCGYLAVNTIRNR